MVDAGLGAGDADAVHPFLEAANVLDGAVLGNLEDHLLRHRGLAVQLGDQPVVEGGVDNRVRKQVDRNRHAVAAPGQARHDLADHQLVEGLDQAEALGHRDEDAGRDHAVVVVEHAQQGLVVVHRAFRAAAHDRLAEEQDLAVLDDLVEDRAPLRRRVGMAAGIRRRAVEHPGVDALALGGAQRRVGLRHQLAEVLVAVVRDAGVGDVHGVDDALVVQAGQGLHQLVGELLGLGLGNVAENDREIGAGDVGGEGFDALQLVAPLGDQFAHFGDEGIGLHIAQLVVGVLEVLDLEDDQRAGLELLGIRHQVAQLHVEILAVAEPGHRVEEVLGADALHRVCLLLEHVLDLDRHPVHGRDHAAQFQRPRHLLLYRVLAVADCLGLVLDRP